MRPRPLIRPGRCAPMRARRMTRSPATMSTMCTRSRRVQDSTECRIVNGDRARGFTLLELLVVMAIIATLLTIAVPRYFRSLERSREAVLQQDLRTLRESIG